MDKISKAQRSANMRAVPNRGTVPEKLIRAMLHRLGYRFRLHRKDLPGTPDVVFISRRKVIFIHGCFWHQHKCKRGSKPTSNRAFWNRKLKRNVERDAEHLIRLKRLGWKALVVWECSLRHPVQLQRRLTSFLDNQKSA